MDYEKLYKEALERAKEFVCIDNIEVAEYIFPELNKLGDEKIREWIIEELHLSYQRAAGDREREDSLKKAIAWLEKQGEQKPAWSDDDEDVLVDVEEAIINYWHGQSQEDLLNWLKSIKDRYTWKPSDKQMEALLSEVNGWTKGCHKQKVLESLYNDLMKLYGTDRQIRFSSGDREVL